MIVVPAADQGLTDASPTTERAEVSLDSSSEQICPHDGLLIGHRFSAREGWP
jgi:hypothetical protein